MSKIDTDYDWSMMSLYHACARRYYYKYVLNQVLIPPVGVTFKPGAMEFGSAIDGALDEAYQLYTLNSDQREKQFLDCYHNAEYRPERFKTLAHMVARSAFKEYWPVDWKHKGYDQTKGYEILDEYCDRYFPEQFEIVDSQVSGAVPVGEWNGLDLNLRIKVDAILFGYEPGYYSIFETKTTGLYWEIFWPAMEMSYQTDGYGLGAEFFFGKTIHSACLNAIHTKTKTDRLKRRPILFSSQRRKNYLQWLHRTVVEITQKQDLTFSKFGYLGKDIHEAAMKATMIGGNPHHDWLENRTNCTAYMRECSYKELCLSDCSPGALSQYQDNTWRPYMRKEK